MGAPLKQLVQLFPAEQSPLCMAKHLPLTPTHTLTAACREAGVRNLKKQLEKIYRKAGLLLHDLIFAVLFW